jgi:hypothetical protein
MIKHSRLATAIAIVAPIAIATAGQSVAAPAHSGASALKASSAAPATKVQYFYDYGPYVYRPVYQYKGFLSRVGHIPDTTRIGEDRARRRRYV